MTLILIIIFAVILVGLVIAVIRLNNLTSSTQENADALSEEEIEELSQEE